MTSFNTTLECGRLLGCRIAQCRQAGCLTGRNNGPLIAFHFQSAFGKELTGVAAWVSYIEQGLASPARALWSRALIQAFCCATRPHSAARPKSAEPDSHVRARSASALLGNLSVHSGAVACLVHRRGRVTVQVRRLETVSTTFFGVIVVHGHTPRNCNHRSVAHPLVRCAAALQAHPS